MICFIGLAVIVLIKVGNICAYSHNEKTCNKLSYSGMMMTKFECSYPEFGYVMATHYSDQMTGSPPNLMSLQCWASTLGPSVRVVEPFVRHSRLGVNLYTASSASAPEAENNSVRLRDVFDLEEWGKKQAMAKRNYAPLVSWDHLIFLVETPRKLILVDRECADEDYGCMDCDTDAQDFAKSSEIFARKYNFDIVRRICFPREVMEESDFRELVYDNYNPKDVVVIFNSWGGISSVKPYLGWHVGITMNKCHRNHFFHQNSFSQTIVKDASKFLMKYIPSKEYIGVMIRLEHYWSRIRSLPIEKGSSLIMECFNNVVHRVTELKNKYNLSEVFLTSDCSKHGSAEFQLNFSERNKMMVKATVEL